MTDNYVETVGWFPLVRHYFYLDATPFVADDIFIRHELRVHFECEFVDMEFPYVVVCCWVWLWQRHEFERCMGELCRKLRFRSADYAYACEAFQAIVRGGSDEEHKV